MIPVTATSLDQAEQAARQPGLAQSNDNRLFWLLLACGLLVIVLVASIAIGSKSIPVGTMFDAPFAYDDSDDHAIIRALPLPRTLLGLSAGMALGMAGALIQALTRNPLADPGILGVNAGAAFFVVLAVGLFGVSTIQGYVWFAFLGAVVTTIAVYAVGSVGGANATPVRLTLAGVAIGAILGGIFSGICLLNPTTFDLLRQWNVGSLVGKAMRQCGPPALSSSSGWSWPFPSPARSMPSPWGRTWLRRWASAASKPGRWPSAWACRKARSRLTGSLWRTWWPVAAIRTRRCCTMVARGRGGGDCRDRGHAGR